MDDDDTPDDDSLAERDTVFESLSAEIQDLAVEQHFPYLVAKARRFLELGPDAYRAADFLHEPETRETEGLDRIRLACEQVSAWRGVTADSPLTGIGIEGIYEFAALMHLAPTMQSGRSTPDGSILDRMEFEHSVTGATTVIWNLVPVEPP